MGPEPRGAWKVTVIERGNNSLTQQGPVWKERKGQREGGKVWVGRLWAARPWDRGGGKKRRTCAVAALSLRERTERSQLEQKGSGSGCPAIE